MQDFLILSSSLLVAASAISLIAFLFSLDSLFFSFFFFFFLPNSRRPAIASGPDSISCPLYRRRPSLTYPWLLLPPWVPLSELLLDISDCPADAAVVIQGNVRVVVGSTATGYYEFILFDCILVCARATPLYHVFCFVNFFVFLQKGSLSAFHSSRRDPF